MEEGGRAPPGGETDANGSIRGEGSRARRPTLEVLNATERRSKEARSTVTAGEEGLELASFGAQPWQQGIAAPTFSV